MKKKLIVILILIILAAGGGYLYHRHQQASPVAAPNSTYTSTAPPVATKAVTIHNYAFSPSDITVKKNSTVTWTNQDLVGYTVTEDDGKTGPASQVIPQNQTYTFKFSALGLFHYHDSLDPNITGTVTVTQ